MSEDRMWIRLKLHCLEPSFGMYLNREPEPTKMCLPLPVLRRV